MYPNLKVHLVVRRLDLVRRLHARPRRTRPRSPNSCYNLVEDPRWADVFDGIDIDWEYPNACGLTCDTSGPAAFKNLIAALRSRFGSSNLVTAAITADGTTGGKIDAADYAGAAQYLDWYNAMTYDYFGAFDAQGPTAPHSPLTSLRRHPDSRASTPTRRSRSSRARASRPTSCCSASASTAAAGPASPRPPRAARRPARRRAPTRRASRTTRSSRPAARPPAPSPAPRTPSAAASGGATTPRPPSAAR